MSWKKIGYWSAYILPGRPTLALITEYIKPREKRNPIKLGAGYLGTAFLLFKIGIATGIITWAYLDDFKIPKKDNKESKTIEQQKNKPNNLEKTINYKEVPNIK